MARALFITEQFIKDNSPINGDLDVKYISSIIDMCQKVYIIPLLGTALYNEIAGEINAGSVSSNNQSLLDDYIQDALLYYVLAEGIAIWVYKIENKSIVKKNSENSSTIDSEEVAMLRDMYRDKAEFFSQRLSNYLMENATQSLYANYLDAGSGIDVVHPKKNSYTSPWVLDGEKIKIAGVPTLTSERDFLRNE